MGALADKSKEELIELVSELQSDNQELQQEVESLAMDNQEQEAEITQYIESDVNVEEISEQAFNAGYEAGENGEALMRSWLNYKVEARI